MRKFTVTFWEKDWSKPIPNIGLTFTVGPYSWDIYGGPLDAEITARGDERKLWRLFELLRNPVVIHNERGEPVWWGVLYTVDLKTRAATFGASLSGMANRVAVAYTYQEPGANAGITRGTTAWAQHDESVAEYGTKELLLSLPNATEQEAIEHRDKTLNKSKTPGGLPFDLDFGNREPFAELYCVGLFQTLEWKYYENQAGYVQYDGGQSTEVLRIGRPDVTGTKIGFDTHEGRQYIYNLDGQLDHLNPGETVYVSGSTSNDGTYTIKSVLDAAEDTISSSQIGFLTSSSGNFLYSLGNLLSNVQQGTYLEVAGSLSNNGVYRVNKAAQGDYTSKIWSTIGFYSKDGKYTIYRIPGGLTWLEGGDVVEVSGSVSNDRGFVVKENYKRSNRSYTSAGITFHDETGSDRIRDSNNGLAVFEVGDIIYVSGSRLPDNNGFNRVVSKASDGSWIKVDTDLDTDETPATVTIEAGNSIDVEQQVTTEEPGAVITIERGQYITLREVLTDEPSGASVTLNVGNYIMTEEVVTDESIGPNVSIRTEAQRVKQSFDIGPNDVWLRSVTVKVGKVGTPTDQLDIQVQNNTKAWAESVLIDPNTLADSPNSVKVEFSESFSIDPGDNVEIVILRNGSLDLENYYTVLVDTNGTYADGQASYYRGGSWLAQASIDVPFAVTGTWFTNRQLEQILTNTGQFIQGYSIPTTNIRTSPYRTGDTTGLDEILPLLSTGTDNGKELMARITQNRYCVIEEEPDPEDKYLYLDAANNVYNPSGEKHNLIKTRCPVGIWVRLKDFVPVPKAQMLFNPSPFFVVRATYNPETDIWLPEPKGSKSVWSVGQTLEG